MYRESYQRGMLTIFFSGGSKPLEIWDTQTKDGYIKRFLDQEIKTMVMEVRGANVSTTYIICPKGNQVLGITMPFLVMIVKNLKKYFSFEVTVLDETGTRRRFRVSNFQSTTQILPLCTVMPIGLADGWNQIQFNLAEFTRRAYKKQFVEVQKLKINANIRLRRVYFTERLIPEDELPPEYKLYFPLSSKHGYKKVTDENANKENIAGPLQTEDNKIVSYEKASKTSIHSGRKSTQTEPGIPRKHSLVTSKEAGTFNEMDESSAPTDVSEEVKDVPIAEELIGGVEQPKAIMPSMEENQLEVSGEPQPPSDEKPADEQPADTAAGEDKTEETAAGKEPGEEAASDS